MTKRLMVAEQWDQFSRAVFNAGTPPIQRKEMRRAFYAGAEMVLVKIMGAISPGDEPTDSDLEIMSSIHGELRDFGELVKSGRA